MSFNAVDAFLTECRVTGQIIRETWLGLKRSGWMNLVIIITMASILSIFGTVLLFLMDVNHFISQIGSEQEISAYLKDGYKAEVLTNELIKKPHIQKITPIPKEKALEDLKQHYEVPLDDNPLPDTLHVQVASVEDIPTVVDMLNKTEGIESVQYAKGIIDKLSVITKGVAVFGSVAAIFLFALSMFIISNTVHLLIESKSREIEILRMMGLGNWYIRLPFILQGAAYGLFGALLAYLPIWVANYYITQAVNFMEFSTQSYSVTSVSILMILIALIVGGIGASMAVRKYLRV